MSDTAWNLMIFYFTAVAITASFGAASYFLDGDRRLGARLMLCAPVWLIALPIVFGGQIGRGIGRLFKEATRR